MHVFDMNAWAKGSVKCIEQNSKGVRDIGGPKTHIRNFPFSVREIFICEHIHKLEPGHLCANEYDQRSHDIAIWN